MATATGKSRAVDGLLRRVAEVRRSALMEFLIVKGNGGAYHWTIVAGDGATLAQSASFASYHDAEQAARRVRDGAASARFDHRATRPHPTDGIALRDPPSDDSDAESWLDEGGSFSSEAVTKWAARR
ncbi:MAG TPA: DUF1508 domain-containing protein [Solirubrobacteraceae bacterium]